MPSMTLERRRAVTRSQGHKVTSGPGTNGRVTSPAADAPVALAGGQVAQLTEDNWQHRESARPPADHHRGGHLRRHVQRALLVLQFKPYPEDLPTAGPRILVPAGAENAGLVDLGGGIACIRSRATTIPRRSSRAGAATGWAESSAHHCGRAPGGSPGFAASPFDDPRTRFLLEGGQGDRRLRQRMACPPWAGDRSIVVPGQPAVNVMHRHRAARQDRAPRAPASATRSCTRLVTGRTASAAPASPPRDHQGSGRTGRPADRRSTPVPDRGQATLAPAMSWWDMGRQLAC
jgi:hypothetical protein